MTPPTLDPTSPVTAVAPSFVSAPAEVNTAKLSAAPKEGGGGCNCAKFTFGIKKRITAVNRLNCTYRFIFFDFRN